MGAWVTLVSPRLSSLAPVATAAYTLYAPDGDRVKEEGPKVLKFLKYAELICEALPQSMLQCVPQMII